MEAHEFTAELTLDHSDRSQLSQTIASPGWLVIERIIKAVVSKYVINLINASEEDEKAIIAKHRMSKAAAQIHTEIAGRVNFELQQFRSAQGVTGPPIDPTDGLIDLGASAAEDDEEFEI